MDTNDLEGRKKKRILLSAQLVIGLHDDIIDWLLSYEQGYRQAAIIETIRLGIHKNSNVKVESGRRGRPPRIADELPQAIPNDLMQRIQQLEHENDLLREYRDYNEQRWLSWEQGSPERPALPIERRLWGREPLRYGSRRGIPGSSMKLGLPAERRRDECYRHGHELPARFALDCAGLGRS